RQLHRHGHRPRLHLRQRIRLVLDERLRRLRSPGPSSVHPHTLADSDPGADRHTLTRSDPHSLAHAYARSHSTTNSHSLTRTDAYANARSHAIAQPNTFSRHFAER
ncbi:MAG: hypothetical protein ACE5E8_03160, partial [Acidimicrobiia bacterium]